VNAALQTEPAPDVSVVIPVKNAAPFLPGLMAALRGQKPAPPREVVLVDSMSSDGTREIAQAYSEIRIVPIERFSHGRARNLGAREARGSIVVLMTQDAAPADERWLARLLEPFSDPRVAAVYSRQAPREDANPMERYFLLTHFPPGPMLRREKKDGSTPSLQNVFFSNVSGAIRRNLLLQYPFDEELIMSEDQQLSRDLIEAGYVVVYQPESVVIHSHNYSLATCVKRYFDSVYSLTKIFPRHDVSTSVAMGWNYIWGELAYIVRHAPLWLPYYVLYTGAKTLGTLLAHVGDHLPRWLLKKVSLHSYYWNERTKTATAA
jgi:rhamnosyltransferase